MDAGGLNEKTVETAIGSECSGCVLYFTESVLESWFIKSAELRAVKRRLERDSDFLVAAVFDGTGHEEAEKLRAATGIDLYAHQGLPLDGESDADVQLTGFSAQLLSGYLSTQGDGPLSARIDSWNEIAPTDGSVLHLNWAGVDGGTGPLPQDWALLKAAATDLRSALEKVGDRRLELSGNTHLAAAFLLGWEFREPTGWTLSVDHARSPIEPQIVAADPQGWSIVPRPSQNDSEELVVRVCASADLGDSVDRHRASIPAARVNLTVFPPGGVPGRTSLNEIEPNRLCAAIVEAVRSARDTYGASITHLYLACPWPMALAIGWSFASSGTDVIHSATPDKTTYHPSPLSLP